MSEYNNINAWVEDLPKRGRLCFSKTDVEQQFPNLTGHNLLIALNRLVVKKKIQSVWRGFYAVILPDYGLEGIVPPIDYIDHLMRHLGKQYYIGLLTAAELYGAAHQAPQEFLVISSSTKLRKKVEQNVKINFVAKKTIPQKQLTQMMTRSCYVNVSNPLLTAYDLICYSKNIGGINRAATVINDLSEKIRFTNIDKKFIQSFAPVVTQRLGYIFEELGFEELSNKLYRKAEIAGQKFRKTTLIVVDKTKDLSKYPVNDKWQLIINEQIDTD